MAPLDNINDSNVIDRFKKRVKLVQEGKIAPIGSFDTETFDSLKSQYNGMKGAVEIIRYAYPHGISLDETKPSPTYNQDVINLEDDSTLIDRFKKRVKLVKEGKIAPSGTYDTDTFEALKSDYNGMKGAAEAIRIAYPHGISLRENAKSSPSPKKDTKEGTKEERRKAYEKQMKNIANEAVRTTNLKNLKGMSNDNVIQAYGKTRGEALVAKRKEAVPELTKEERRKAYEKQMKNIANEAVRTTNLKNLKGMSNDNIIQAYGKTRGEALVAKRKKAGPEPTKKGTKEELKTFVIEGDLPMGKRIEVFLEGDKEYIKKFSVNSVRVAGTVINSGDGWSTISYMDPRKESEKSQKKTQENLNFEKMMEEDEEEEREQIKMAAEQERRRKDRESQKKSQEKQRKDFEAEQKRIWEEFEKRQNQKKKAKTPLTPMREVKIAGGSEKFAFAKTITKCSRVLTLDQVNVPTCWFNALMMALFFSQNTRILIASSLPYIKDKSKIPIIVDIGKLLEGYNKTRASGYLYKRLQPKEFLETLREKQPSQFPPRNRDSKLVKGEYDYYKGDSAEYMHRMLQFLEIPHLLLSRASMKSGKTEWSYYNYDLYESKLFGAQTQVGFRTNASTYPKFVDTHHPMILTICTEDDHDKGMAATVSSKWKKYKTYPVEGLLSDGHASVIKYNGKKYYLDSLILGNYNTTACTKGHAIAGVTCNGDRFLYNGYTNKTVDPGMKKNYQGGAEACPLEPVEWAHTTNFCMSNTCGFDKFVSKIETKELCFSTLRNARLTYVREDYIGSRIPSIPTAIDRMKQKQTEEGIFNNQRLKNMGILKKDPKTGKYVVTKK